MASDGQVAAQGSGRNWLPVESNSELLSSYSTQLGLPEETGLQFHDVLGTEDWALEMIPQPARAVVLLYPIKEKTEEYKEEQAKLIETEGQTLSSKCFFVKQTADLGNACGTIAILHTFANLSEHTGGDLKMKDGSFLNNYIKDNLEKSPEERAEALSENETVEAAHEAVVQGGQSEVCEDTWNHFAAFTEKDGHLYEFDGRKRFPINHGPTTKETLLADAVKVIKANFMDRDPEEVGFAMLALAPVAAEEEETAGGSA